jgi:hypothetical protein
MSTNLVLLVLIAMYPSLRQTALADAFFPALNSTWTVFTVALILVWGQFGNRI